MLKSEPSVLGLCLPKMEKTKKILSGNAFAPYILFKTSLHFNTLLDVLKEYQKKIDDNKRMI